jgi:uncharacterized membrane protein YjfL (UPF0719 family)
VKKQLIPLWVFVSGQIAALVAFLFLGSIGDAATQLQTDAAAYSSVFWNFDWVTNPNVVKFLVFLLIELLTLYATAKIFIKTR